MSPIADRTATLLRKVEALAYTVSVFRVNGAIEIHAVPSSGEGDPHIARCNDGDGDEEAYRAACMLIEALGIDLRDDP